MSTLVLDSIHCGSLVFVISAKGVQITKLVDAECYRKLSEAQHATLDCLWRELESRDFVSGKWHAVVWHVISIAVSVWG